MLRSIASSRAAKTLGRSYAWETPEFLSSAERAQAYARLHRELEPRTASQLVGFADTLSMLEAGDARGVESPLRSDVLTSIAQRLQILGERTVAQDFLDAATSHAATPPPQPKPIVPALGPMTLSLAPTDTERSTKMTLLSTNRFFAL
mmetsp:Transcript_54523/g.150187  ORF Transcript_54523/g.150187 Transcript_54523/m.150187 type:complete len:148 (+) Transcript_54523:30-473(+)